MSKNFILRLLFLFTWLFFYTHAQAQFAPYDIKSTSGNYSFSYTQVPGNLIPAHSAITALSYSWEKSTFPMFNDDVTVVATTASYNINAPLSQTTYYRRKSTLAGSVIVYSNVIKINIVSQHHENVNYVREHDILISGQTDWETIDQLPIGQKLQTTTYMDGLG